jgi:wyosine [tRNA(Phe)-imidazoG37] synthetase (radical SAM superfamily)
MSSQEREATPTYDVRHLRLLLTEYKNVVMGLRVLSKKLFNRSDAGAPRLALQLRSLQERLSVNQKVIFQLEVNDAYLERLAANLEADAESAEEITEFWGRLNRIRQLLSALGSWTEKAQGRDPYPTATPTIEENGWERQLNRQLLAYEVILGRTMMQSAPLRHNLDIISKCNLRCLTCHQSTSQDFISFDIADAPMEVLLPAIHLADEVNITGVGETLLSRAAGAIVGAYKQAGAYVILQTNGTVSARLSALAPIVDALWLSLDGGTAESYNLIRRWGNYKKLITFLGQLPIEARRKVSLNFVVCKQNITTAEACLKMAVELNFGQVHFQEMTAYLPWHDRMQIDDEERRYFFENFPRWEAEAAEGGVYARCNLTAPSTFPVGARSRLVGMTTQGIDDFTNVPLPKGAATLDPVAISAELDSYKDTKVPASIAEIEQIMPDVEPEVVTAPPQDICGDRYEFYDALVEAQSELSQQMAAGVQLSIPHCLAAFSHLVLNNDGTTRACCSVQASMASVYEQRFAEVWNSAAYQEMRHHHARHVAAQAQCADCRDPMRFFHLIEILKTLKEDGIDLSLVQKPGDFPLPGSMAEHPLVRELGSGLLQPIRKAS